MILQEIVNGTLQDLARKLRGKGAVTPELLSEFRNLVETAYRLSDMRKVEELEARLLDLENRFNLSRVPQDPKSQNVHRKTPRLM